MLNVEFREVPLWIVVMDILTLALFPVVAEFFLSKYTPRECKKVSYSKFVNAEYQ